MTNPNPVAPKTDTPARPMPKREQVFMRTGLIRVMYDASEMDDYLESTLAAERASRLQAETEQFNAGILDAAQACMREHLHEPQDEEDAAYDRAVDDCYKAVLRQTKPSVSPEQAVETK